MADALGARGPAGRGLRGAAHPALDGRPDGGGGGRRRGVPADALQRVRRQGGAGPRPRPPGDRDVSGGGGAGAGRRRCRGGGRRGRPGRRRGRLDAAERTDEPAGQGRVDGMPGRPAAGRSGRARRTARPVPRPGGGGAGARPAPGGAARPGRRLRDRGPADAVVCGRPGGARLGRAADRCARGGAPAAGPAAGDGGRERGGRPAGAGRLRRAHGLCGRPGGVSAPSRTAGARSPRRSPA